MGNNVIMNLTRRNHGAGSGLALPLMPWSPASGVFGSLLGTSKETKAVSGKMRKRMEKLVEKGQREKKNPGKMILEYQEELNADRLGQLVVERFKAVGDYWKAGTCRREQEHERLAKEMRVFRDTGFGDLVMAFYDMKEQAEKAGVKMCPLSGMACTSFVMYLLGFTKENPYEKGIGFEFGRMA